MTKAIPITEARDDLGGIVNRVALRGDRIPLSKNGKQLAVVVSIEDAELLERLEDEADILEAERILADPTETPIPFVPKG